MYEAIKNFNEQFAYEPVVENEDKFSVRHKYIVFGMGGSHLAADIVKTWNPTLHIMVRSNYGIPVLHEHERKEYVCIASSYSGNTEEVIDGYVHAISDGIPTAAIATGGKLLELAKKNNSPYVELPAVGIQPRSALGYGIRAFLKVMGLENGLAESGELVKTLQPAESEEYGKKLAEDLKGCIPVIYASERNRSIAYNWKIKCNETGKIPAFYNVFPELNHNEMAGFDVIPGTRALSEKFVFIILKDKTDHPKIQKRMDILEKLYNDRGLRVLPLTLAGKNSFHKIFSSLVLADWFSYYTAKQYGADPEPVPMVEEFKRLIA